MCLWRPIIYVGRSAKTPPRASWIDRSCGSCEAGDRMTDEPKGGDLFIVDNSLSGWTGLRYLEEWCDLATGFDLATGRHPRRCRLQPEAVIRSRPLARTEGATICSRT